jgi:hypothetical protein
MIVYKSFNIWIIYSKLFSKRLLTEYKTIIKIISIFIMLKLFIMRFNILKSSHSLFNLKLLLCLLLYKIFKLLKYRHMLMFTFNWILFKILSILFLIYFLNKLKFKRLLRYLINKENIKCF